MNERKDPTEAAVSPSEIAQDGGQEAGNYEFKEVINRAVNMDVADFATPEISQEEAVSRLMRARDTAEAAVNQEKMIQHTADLPIEAPGQPEKTDNPEAILESSLTEATTLDEIIAAVKTYGNPIQGSEKSYNIEIICELIDKSQGHRAWIDYIPNTHGLRDAVIRVLGPAVEQAPEQEILATASPEVKKVEDQQRRIQVPPPRQMGSGA
ncbi:MAG: hypothetical protein NTV39_00655 [Candidatus Saccharibacteria bacterium]|nr:hypothetical protein [Candidatus Saccharibacteria bacterium]